MSRLAILSSFMDATTGQGGEYWECGTFRGDAALYVKERMIGPRTMRLFDTFCGQPTSGPHDIHKVGSMAETSYDLVSGLFSGHANVYIHQGIMPATFAGLEDSVISVANIDVDNHDAVRDCLAFIYPRVPPGGYIVLDDYNCPACPGAKKATNDFLSDKPEQLVTNGPFNPQAYFIKL